MHKKLNAVQSREYMVSLYRKRSVIALCCCIISLMLAFYALIASVIKTVETLGINGFHSFIYFTLISNTLAALSTAFVFPFAVEGVQKKRFTLPRWVAVFHYLATTSVVIVMAFTFAFISWAAPKSAFGGPNLYLHVFCPALILISFFQMENEHIYTVKDRLIGCVPFFVYIVVYYIEVVLIGEANGGWADIYYICENLPPLLAVPLVLLFGFCVSTLIALLSNRLTRKRKAEMFQYWKEDTDPVEVLIEAYGLGRMTGLSGEKNSIQIPFDILEQLAEKYKLNPDDLVRPFVTGLRNGLKERE